MTHSKSHKAICQILFGFTIFANTLSAQIIDLDYIYEKESLGIDSIDRYEAKGFQWSPNGHEFIFRRESKNLGNILVWMDLSSPDNIKYWPEKNLYEATLEPEGQEIQGRLNYQDLKFPKPNLIGKQTSSPRGTKKNKKAKKDFSISARWNATKNTLEISSELGKAEFNPKAQIVSAINQARDSSKTRGENVTLSPNRRFEAYTKDGNLFVYDIQDEREVQLTKSGGKDDILNGKFPWVYWEELMWRSTYRAFEWSPNNDRIAFFEFDESGTDVYPLIDYSSAVPKTKLMTYPKAGNRNPRIRLGIISLSSRAIKWAELPDLNEYLIHIFWDNSGEFIYVQGMNRKQDHVKLYSIDVGSGIGSLVLEEKGKAWVNTYNMPMFPDSEKRKDQFIWLSERSGFNHLYLVSKDGKNQEALTSGNWEVIRKGFNGKQIFYLKDNDKLFFAGKDQGPTEKHFYSIRLSDKKLNRITPDSGNHTATFSNDNEYFIDSWTSKNVASRIDLRDQNGKLVLTLRNRTRKDYRPFKIPRLELLTIQPENGLSYHASLMKPIDFDPQKKYPVVAYVYGEPAGQVVSNSFPRDWDIALAHNGFIVFRFDGRGTPGRGREWLNSVYLDQMTNPMEDWSHAVKYLKSLKFVDQDHLGVWGWSGGGTMTLNLMLRKPGLFHAGAAVAAVTDKALYDTIYTERYLQRPQDNPEGYKLSSPLFAAENLEGKLLVAHGIGDDNVHIQNAHNLVTELNKFNKPYELYLYPQKGHGIEGSKNRKHLYSRLLAFFEKHLLSQ